MDLDLLKKTLKYAVDEASPTKIWWINKCLLDLLENKEVDQRFYTLIGEQNG